MARHAARMPVETGIAGPCGDAPGFDPVQVTYAHPAQSRLAKQLIRVMERCSGKDRLLELLHALQADTERGCPFWDSIVRRLELSIATPVDQIMKVPQHGPAIIVANHPHGIIDGILLGALISRRRDDFKILARPHFAVLPQTRKYLLPIPFGHEANFGQLAIESRANALRHLRAGGCIAVFPAGTVSAAPFVFGSTVEREWGNLTARLIVRSRATVIPIRIRGQASRRFQLAHNIATSLRMGLFIHELMRAVGRTHAPVVGDPLDYAKINDIDPDMLMAQLRRITIQLTDDHAERSNTTTSI